MRSKITVILFFALFLLLFHINKPFIGQHDWNGAFWGNITRNYLANLAKGIGNPGWIEKDYVNPGKLIFFFHYTPFMPVLYSLSSLALGLSETSLRIVTVLMSLVMIYYIYRIGRLIGSERIGLTASMFAIVTPMFLYYGKLPDHEPILTPFCTASFYYYLLLDKRKKKKIILFYIFLLFALLESWAGFFLLGALILHGIFFQRGMSKMISGAVILGGIVALFQAILIVSYYGAGYIGDLFKYALVRMGIESGNHTAQFTLRQFLETEARYSVIYFTRVFMMLSGLWFIRMAFAVIKKKNIRDLSLIVLFIYGAAFILVFRNLAFIHDYKLYLLLPFISLSSAIAIDGSLSFALRKLKSKIPFSPVMAKNVILISVIFIAATERTAYLRTILNSSFDKPGYNLGKIINYRVLPGEKVLLNSLEFDDFYGGFARFYANREITAADLTLSNFQKNQEEYRAKYRYIVLVDGRPADDSLKKYLMSYYIMEKTDIYSLVDLKSPRNKQKEVNRTK